MRRAEASDPWLWCLAVFAAANLANAVWMLLDPAGWFTGLPAAVPDTGPYNSHFVRDLGGAFAVMGGALCWAALRPAARLPVLASVAAFYLLHALIHATDTFAGRLPRSHWTIDLPGVYLPTAVLLGLAWMALRRRESWT